MKNRDIYRDNIFEFLRSRVCGVTVAFVVTYLLISVKPQTVIQTAFRNKNRDARQYHDRSPVQKTIPCTKDNLIHGLLLSINKRLKYVT